MHLEKKNKHLKFQIEKGEKHAHLWFHQKVSLSIARMQDLSGGGFPLFPPSSASFNYFTYYCCKSKQRQNSLHIHKWESERVASGPAERTYNSLIKLETKREGVKSEWTKGERETNAMKWSFIPLFSHHSSLERSKGNKRMSSATHFQRVSLSCSSLAAVQFFYLRVGAST